MSAIQCRARISGEDCSHGHHQTEEQWELYPWEEDGTYEPDDAEDTSGTIVCNACYCELGCPTLDDLPLVLAAAKEIQRQRTLDRDEAARSAGAAERDEALQRVERGATDIERQCVAHALRIVIERGVEFTADDVWAEMDRLDMAVREPRLLGAVIRKAAFDKQIIRTNQVRESVLPQRHCRPCRVWVPAGGAQ